MTMNPEDCESCDIKVDTTKLIEQLKDAKEDLEQFAYIASHDLREPLIGIAGYATLLKKRYSGHLDDDGRRFLEGIIEASKRMEAKIDDLLAFSRAGQGAPHRDFPLGAAIDEAKRSLVGRIKHTGARIVLKGKIPTARGDRSMIAQVFQNLFGNSIKYRGQGVEPIIEVQVRSHSDTHWLIVVKDNGIGFDIEHRERIFKVFQRLYTVEQYSGTGIGLALAKKIVERHDGEIWAESEAGKGSTFYFSLPKCEP